MEARNDVHDQGAQNAYDEVPYSSHPFKQSHPDHLHAIARLFKLPVVPPDQASILELGCAAGGNLIPLAAQMPDARVVGVDLSSRQIAEGQATVDALGLKNCKLHAMDFQAIDDSFGHFDYIICHGVYSWVPAAAQKRIFEICRDRLTPNGVAYISYNAYPGWFMRGMIRQMMLHHTAQFSEPAAKVKQARALLQFIVDATEGQNTPYSVFLRQEMETLRKQPDYYLFHDHLEDNNWPIFFYQFIEQTQAHGLQFLSESSLADMITGNLPPKAAEALTKLTPDLHQRAQYTDFITNRMFRQSLVCRAGLALDRQIGPASVEGGRFAALFRQDDTVKNQDLRPDVEVMFVTTSGRKQPTKHPVMKAMGYALIDAWPQSLTIEQIVAAARSKLASAGMGSLAEGSQFETMITGFLLTMLGRGHVDLRFLPDRFVSTVSDKPMISPLARLQCADPRSPVTTQTHTLLGLDAMMRLVSRQLDGTKTRQDLINAMGKWLADGVIKVSAPEGQVVDIEAFKAASIDRALQRLKQQAMLVG